MIISYQNRQLSAERLKVVAMLGCTIQVNFDQLNVIHSDDSSVLVVTQSSKEGQFDVLLGTPKQGRQQARLLSKIVLKKAVHEVLESIQYTSEPARDEGYRRDYNHDQRPRPASGQPYRYGDRRY